MLQIAASNHVYAWHFLLVIRVVPFHQLRVFTPDTTRSQLLPYTIDLDSGRMAFTFDEVIRLATFTPNQLTFKDASSINLHEPGSSFQSEDGLSVIWSMTILDLNLLTVYERVFGLVESLYATYSYLSCCRFSIVDSSLLTWFLSL